MKLYLRRHQYDRDMLEIIQKTQLKGLPSLTYINVCGLVSKDFIDDYGISNALRNTDEVSVELKLCRQEKSK